MPLNKVKEFLNAHGTNYVAISHSRAYTAQGIAAVSHISGRELAKAVIVKLDGDLAMAVLPASYQVDLEQLRRKTGVRKAELATEREFEQHFPDCETGAMRPSATCMEFRSMWMRRSPKIARSLSMRVRTMS